MRLFYLKTAGLVSQTYSSSKKSNERGGTFFQKLTDGSANSKILLTPFTSIWIYYAPLINDVSKRMMIFCDISDDDDDDSRAPAT